MALVAMCFVQDPGRMIADTKFDLLTEPWRFLQRGFSLWDPNAAFGQVPDQSYGYAWPMGPFFGVGNLVNLPPWVIQRAWWALLVCLAFFGILRLTERLGIGSEVTRVIAAFAFVLTPRITTLVGVVSIEVWPMALAPVGAAAADPRLPRRGRYVAPRRPARSSWRAAEGSTRSPWRLCCRWGSCGC